jgi:hypothetical protein
MSRFYTPGWALVLLFVLTVVGCLAETAISP